MRFAGKNVLIIDDNPEFARSLKFLIEEVGKSTISSVDCVFSVVEGIRFIKNKRFHYVFINSEFPNQDGIMAIHLINTARPEITIIACSFYNSMFYQFQIENAGAARYLSKDEIDCDSLTEIFNENPAIL